MRDNKQHFLKTPDVQRNLWKGFPESENHLPKTQNAKKGSIMQLLRQNPNIGRYELTRSRTGRTNITQHNAIAQPQQKRTAELKQTNHQTSTEPARKAPTEAERKNAGKLLSYAKGQQTYTHRTKTATWTCTDQKQSPRRRKTDIITTTKTRRVRSAEVRYSGHLTST